MLYFFNVIIHLLFYQILTIFDIPYIIFKIREKLLKYLNNKYNRVYLNYLNFNKKLVFEYICIGLTIYYL